MCSIDEEIKRALDVDSATAALIGLRPYSVTVVRATYVTGSTETPWNLRPGKATVKTGSWTETPILIGPGYTGNPAVSQISSKEIFLDDSRYSDAHYKIGPIVEEYGTPGDTVCSSGGTPVGAFMPYSTGSISGTNECMWVKIEGPGMETSGSYFDIVRRKIDSSVSFSIYVKKTGERPR